MDKSEERRASLAAFLSENNITYAFIANCIDYKHLNLMINEYKISDAINFAFTWSFTTEGHDFWEKIYNKACGNYGR